MTDLIVHLQHLGFEAEVLRERDSLRSGISGKESGLDSERGLRPGQPERGKLGTTGLQDSENPRDPHGQLLQTQQRHVRRPPRLCRNRNQVTTNGVMGPRSLHRVESTALPGNSQVTIA
ncbi:MAG: hypothetical protein ABJA93_08460 [Sporichthyaceae bacterium]